ncbi:MAG: leucine--tRNA ligase, partial [Candidatus Pacebacteria bacterium]|nr:leucine--tRNA ligase [Candidatus Paceibacterota bacterium]
MKKYDHKKIEKKWAKDWEEKGIYKTSEDSDKEKFYILDMFPYPSGAGLHVGHPKGYIATDIFARVKRMKGFNVLHPMGWDAFGLPAENFALKNKEHPRTSTEKNIATFKEQLGKLGFSYDWDREINTTDPKFYKWTQWAFIQMFKKGLAYESYEPINWCPSCKTGLANEDLENGRCERCDSEIEKKPMRQWVLKITDYAERLLQDLDKLPNWDKSIKEMQRNWIGKSEGARIKFQIKDLEKEIEVFTTRPDTLFGATYMVLSPEHKLVEELKDQIKNWEEVEKYQKESQKKSEIDRLDLTKEKTGVQLKGISAINPAVVRSEGFRANNEEIPIFIADYVLSSYGTGAIMAVPAHDERDNEFAIKYNLPITQVISSQTDEENKVYTGDGELVNSAQFDGLSS